MQPEICSKQGDREIPQEGIPSVIHRKPERQYAFDHALIDQQADQHDPKLLFRQRAHAFREKRNDQVQDQIGCHKPVDVHMDGTNILQNEIHIERLRRNDADQIKEKEKPDHVKERLCHKLDQTPYAKFGIDQKLPRDQHVDIHRADRQHFHDPGDPAVQRNVTAQGNQKARFPQCVQGRHHQHGKDAEQFNIRISLLILLHFFHRQNLVNHV